MDAFGATDPSGMAWIGITGTSGLASVGKDITEFTFYEFNVDPLQSVVLLPAAVALNSIIQANVQLVTLTGTLVTVSGTLKNAPQTSCTTDGITITDNQDGSYLLTFVATVLPCSLTVIVGGVPVGPFTITELPSPSNTPSPSISLTSTATSTPTPSLLYCHFHFYFYLPSITPTPSTSSTATSSSPQLALLAVPLPVLLHPPPVPLLLLLQVPHLLAPLLLPPLPFPQATRHQRLYLLHTSTHRFSSICGSCSLKNAKHTPP